MTVAAALLSLLATADPAALTGAAQAAAPPATGALGAYHGGGKLETRVPPSAGSFQV